MEQFPILANGQVALLRAEIITGHVLDENLRLAVSDDQKIYTVFATYDEALAAAYKIVNNGRIECIIYGTDKEVLKYLTT